MSVVKKALFQQGVEPRSSSPEEMANILSQKSQLIEIS